MIKHYSALPVLTALMGLLLLLVGCTSPRAPVYQTASDIPDAIPKVEPRSRYGNPEWYVVFGKKYEVMNDASGFSEEGIASWYGKKFHGRRTSSGETYDMYAMTAAHKSLPLPSYVKVTNLENQRTAIVIYPAARINAAWRCRYSEADIARRATQRKHYLFAGRCFFS